MSNKQSSIDKDFVPYEESLSLKELGFDEPCFGSWETEYAKVPTYTHSCSQFYKNSNHPKGKVTAPTFSQAFGWFREKHNLMPLVDRSYMNLYEFRVVEKAWGYTASTYEEAEIACLNKLIEIVKNK